jgi:hypothetical protein
MKFFKRTENGYITLIGRNCGGEEITEQEYDAIMKVIRNKPTAPDGYDFKLTEKFEWEMFELPPRDEEELTAEEALAIITGGAV